MADGLTTQTTVATIPNATKIATDDAGAAGHVQMVKLAIATDGDATALTADNTDGLLVNLGTNNDVTVTGTVTVGSHAVTNAGTFAVQADSVIPGTGATNLGKAEDVAHASGDVGVMALAVRTDTPANRSATDGDYEPLQVSAGRVWTSATIDAALPAGTNNIGDVDVLTLPALPAGTNNIGDVDVLSIAAGDNNIGNVDVVTVPAPLSTTGGGTEATALRVTVASDSTGVLSVDDNGGALTVDNAGTFATQVDGAALTALQLIDDPVFADDAAFTVATSKVMAAGIHAVAHGAAPDAADAGDAVIPLANRHRVLWTIGGHPNAKSAVYLSTGAATDDNVLAAISAGTKYAITRISITLDEATTVGVACRLGFGTSTVPALPSTNADAVDDVLFYHPGIVPGSHLTVGDGSGILGVGGDGAELRITCEAPTTGTLVVVVTYYPIES